MIITGIESLDTIRDIARIIKENLNKSLIEIATLIYEEKIKDFHSEKSGKVTCEQLFGEYTTRLLDRLEAEGR